MSSSSGCCCCCHRVTFWLLLNANKHLYRHLPHKLAVIVRRLRLWIPLSFCVRFCHCRRCRWWWFAIHPCRNAINRLNLNTLVLYRKVPIYSLIPQVQWKRSKRTTRYYYVTLLLQCRFHQLLLLCPTTNFGWCCCKLCYWWQATAARYHLHFPLY